MKTKDSKTAPKGSLFPLFFYEYSKVFFVFCATFLISTPLSIVKEIKSVKLGGKSMNHLLYVVMLLSIPYIVCTLAMLARFILFVFNDEMVYIEPLLKSYVWFMIHPVKIIKMGVDGVVVGFMMIEDLLFKAIVKRKYKSYKKRLNRVQYEDERSQEEMKSALTMSSDWMKLLSDCMDDLPAGFYTPRKVVYEEYEQWSD